MRLTLPLLTWLLILAPTALIGQVSASDLEAGERIRYKLVERPPSAPRFEEVSFLAITSSTLSATDIDSRAAIVVPLADLSSLEVVRGTKDLRWVGAALLGITGCVVLGTALGNRGDQSSADAFMGCVVGLPVGATAGFFVGKAIKGPRWVVVDFGGAEEPVALGIALPVSLHSRGRG